MKIRIKQILFTCLLMLVSIATTWGKRNDRDSLVQAEIKYGAKLITEYQRHNQFLRQKRKFDFQKYVIDEFVTAQEGKLRRPGGYITDKATQRLNEVLRKVNLLTGAEIYVLIAPSPPLAQNLAMTREEQIADLKDQLRKETIEVTKAIAQLANINATKDNKSGVIYFRLGTIHTPKDEIYNLYLSAVLGYYLEQLAFGEAFDNFISSNESEAFHEQTWRFAMQAQDYWRDQIYKDNVIKGYSYVFLRLLLNAFRGADIKPIPKVDPKNLLAFVQNEALRSINLEEIPRKDLNFFINGLEAKQANTIYNELRLHLAGVLRQSRVSDKPMIKMLEAKTSNTLKPQPQVVKKLVKNINTPKAISRTGTSTRGGYIWIVLVAIEGYQTYQELSEDKKQSLKDLNSNYQQAVDRWRQTNNLSNTLQKLYQGTITDLEAYKVNFYYYLKIYQRFLNLYFTGEKDLNPYQGQGMACRVRRIIDPYNPKLAQHFVVKKARRDGQGIFDFEDNLNLVPYLDDILYNDEPTKQPEDWQPTLLELLNQVSPNNPKTGLTDEAYYYEELKKILIAVKIAYQEFFQKGDGFLKGDKPLTQKLLERFTEPFGTDFLRRIKEIYTNVQNFAKEKGKRDRMADLQVKKQKLERQGKQLSASEANELWELENYFRLLEKAHRGSLTRQEYEQLKIVEKLVYPPEGITSLNDNDAVGNFGVYSIKINSRVYKFGKANLDETNQVINPYTNQIEVIPVRIQLQLRKLRRKYDTVRFNVEHKIGYVTTKKAKEVEDDYIFGHYYVNKEVPEGNRDSFNLKAYLERRNLKDPHGKN